MPENTGKRRSVQLDAEMAQRSILWAPEANSEGRIKYIDLKQVLMRQNEGLLLVVRSMV